MTERLTTKWIAACGLAALTAGGCASRHDDAWLTELRMREAAARPLRDIGSTDGAFASRVPAEMRGSIETGEEADYIALDIGGETPVECALYHDEVESASTVQTLAAQVFAGLEKRHGTVIERTPGEIDAGVVAGSPFLRVSWTYRTTGEQAEVVGQLKQMIATREGRSVYCVHHENGYAKSFENLFRELVSHVRFSSYDDLRPYFTQIDILSTDGERFGFATVSLTLDEDGEPRVVRYTTQLARTAEGGLTARDVTEVEHSSLQGAVRGQVFTDFRDGEVSSSLVLEDLAGVGWQVRGQRGGANLRAIFEQPDLSSWLGDARTLGGLVAAGDGQSLASTRIWDPDFDAEASVERRYQLRAPLQAQLWEVSAVTGDRQAWLAVDGDGLIQAMKAVENDRTVLRERVFVEGALR